MKILEELGIKTDHESLYERAFTHTSYANEHGLQSYERLEYLGDAVLELFMSDYLFRNTEYDEGMMTKLRAHYVCEEALYEYSLKLKLNEELLLGKGEEENGGKYRKAIVADIFEAFIGALYLDQGNKTVTEFLNTHVIPMIETHKLDFINDYKSVLQELVQTDKRSLEYSVINEEGPAHNKIFTVEVRIDSIRYGVGSAHSKKEAEQEAAKDALKKAQNGERHVNN
ncbi:MAG: ribonuclease III [Bacilli bacterium]|jgi:ribonuclease-3|nr:ribonuclease III [Bacilli bacterium]